jgi:hypothetical protein
MALMSRDSVAVGPLSDISVALEDAKSPEATSEESYTYGGVVRHVEERFHRAREYRRPMEDQWLTDYRNYRGVYGPDVQFAEQERSRIFLKLTKTKVLAAYGQLVDVLFSGVRFPIGVEPKKTSSGLPVAAHIDPQAPQLPEAPPEPEDPYGWPGDGREFDADGKLSLGPYNQYDQLPWTEGEGNTPTAVTIHPAKRAAEKLERKIQDQLDECEGNKHLRYVAFEAALFGTGILAGPFLSTKETPKWDADGTYKPERKTVPRLEAVSIWDIYPDPDANTVPDCEFLIRRRKMSRSQLRQLKRRPMFRPEAIEYAIDQGMNYRPEWWEHDLQESNNKTVIERYEVLDYWGYIDRQVAEEAGLEIPESLDDFDSLEVNVWTCNGTILRCVLNPFTPSRIPFALVPYEISPYSPFGIGVASNMSDGQAVVNGFLRMTIDNAALSGNVILEVDEGNLVPGQDLRVYPGKIFRRQGGAPGQAIFATKFQNTTNENLAVVDKAMAYIDTATGIPSYTHGGQTQGSGVGRTAAGMSMLMGASSVNIKSTIKNFDDFLLAPLARALVAFNMQFEFDPEITGELEVVARGTESLLRNEVRSQRLMTFLQIAAGNPALAPHAKFPYIMREIAKVLDLDPEQVCNDPSEAQAQALLMQMMGGGGGGPPGGQEADMSGNGGGTMGVGGVPTPGEPGHTANTGAAGAPPPTPGMPPQ